MRQIPLKLRKEMAADPEYRICIRKKLFNDHDCKPDPVTGKLIEWEHAFIYAGKQINEKWAIIPICWWAHRGPGLNKEMNQYIAISRANSIDFDKYPRFDFQRRKIYLNDIYAKQLQSI